MNKYMIGIGIFLFVAILFNLTSHAAKEGSVLKRAASPLFDLLDKNRNGALDASELAEASKLIEKFDLNSNGILEKSEVMKAAGLAESSKSTPDTATKVDELSFLDRILKLDKDGDKKLSEEELTDRFRSILQQFDTNMDKFIDQNELMKLKAEYEKRFEDKK